MTARLAPVDPDDPEPGFYKRRLIRGGPWAPARIWRADGDRDPETGELMSDQILKCEVNGLPADPFAEWTWLAGNPISRAEYVRLKSAAKATNVNQPTNYLTDRVPFT